MCVSERPHDRRHRSYPRLLPPGSPMLEAPQQGCAGDYNNKLHTSISSQSKPDSRFSNFILMVVRISFNVLLGLEGFQGPHNTLG